MKNLANIQDFGKPAEPPYPIPNVQPEMFSGLVGNLVEVFEPTTEASPVGLALQFLIAFGSAVGHRPHFYVGETKHFANEFVAIVGTSSRSRKGDSKNSALRPLNLADKDWSLSRTASGLSSAEGLIWAIRDPVTKVDEHGEEKTIIEGIDDKRLLVIETEFTATLKQFFREGNTLSNTIRDAWDCKSPLQNLVKKNPAVASNPHISIIAHTTPEDLQMYLRGVDIANGLGNRFLFPLVHRTKLLPSPPRADQEALKALVAQVSEALKFGRKARRLKRTRRAREYWESIYPELTREEPGLIGYLLARSEAHVVRLSALYALLARSPVITTAHIRSALAVWRYCEESVRTIFAKRTGNPFADKIIEQVPPGTRITRKELRGQIFSNHIDNEDLESALSLLKAEGYIHREKVAGQGRYAELIIRLDPAPKAPKAPLHRATLKAAPKAPEAPRAVGANRKSGRR